MKSIFDIVFHRQYLKYKSEVDINELDDNGDNALIAALIRDDYDTARFLLEEGIDILPINKYSAFKNYKSINKDFISSYEYLIMTKNHPEVQKLLIKRGLSIIPDSKATKKNLCLTYQASDLEVLKILVENNNPLCSPESGKEKYQTTALNNIPSNYEMWEYLVKEKNIPINNYPSQNENTILFKYYNIEDIKKLVELGIDLNRKTYSGIPFLFISSSSNLNYLIDNGIDVMAINENDENIFFFTDSTGIDILMERKIALNINHVNKEGNTPFMIAVREGKLNEIKSFLKYGVDINTHIGNKHCLMFANTKEMISLLMKYGASFAFALKNDNYDYEKFFSEKLSSSNKVIKESADYALTCLKIERTKKEKRLLSSALLEKSIDTNSENLSKKRL